MRGGLTHLALVACVVAPMAVAGCGGSTPGATTTAAATRTQALTPAQQARADKRAARRAQIALEHTFAPNPYRQPPPAPPHAQPLRRVVVRDVKRGRGPALRGDEVVYANYVKTYWHSGNVVYVAWGPLRADYLQLSGAPPGIRRGMTGMRPGGRRTIAIPAAISDVHQTDGTGWEAAVMDVVLRKIV